MNFCIAKKKKWFAIERWTKDMEFTIGIKPWIDVRTHIDILCIRQIKYFYLKGIARSKDTQWETSFILLEGNVSLGIPKLKEII